MNPQDPKYQQKSKATSSTEPNYFVHFAMRHPVVPDNIKYKKSFDLPVQFLDGIINDRTLCISVK